jgi:hypothetical protein
LRAGFFTGTAVAGFAFAPAAGFPLPFVISMMFYL